MDVQFVFGNPVKAKKIAKSENKSTIRERGSGMTRDAKGRFRKKRNPQVSYLEKGKGKKKKRQAVSLVTRKDLQKLAAALKSARKKGKSVPGYAKTAAKIARVAAAAKKRRKASIAAVKKLKSQGFKVVGRKAVALRPEDLMVGLATLPATRKSKSGGKGKSVAAKKSRSKKSAAKKSRSKKSAAKKSRSRKSAAKRAVKRAAPRRRRRRHHKKLRFIGRRQRFRSAARRARYRHPLEAKLKLRGRKYRRVRLSVSKVKRGNPFGGAMGSMFKSYTGHEVMEAGALALGGGLYGAANGLLAKLPVVKDIHAQMVKIPVVGSALPTLVLGALLHKFGEMRRIGALQTVGKGLVGASVVGMGVNASQMIPGLKAGMSGVDYTRLSGVDYTALGADVSPADFGAGQLGEIPYGELPAGLGADVSPADFGEIAYGELPEGLGEGQMG